MACTPGGTRGRRRRSQAVWAISADESWLRESERQETRISGRRGPGVCLHVSLDEYFILLPSRAPQPTALSLRLYTFSCLPPCFPFVPRRCAAYCCFLFSFFCSLSAVLRATQSCVSLKFLLRTNEFTQLAQETYRLTVGVKNGYFHFTSHVQHPASQLALDCE